MESLSLKLDSRLSKAVDRIVREKHYSTKTEFVRETIRERVIAFEEAERKDLAWNALLSMRGVLKGMGAAKTDEAFRELRNKASDEFMKRLEKRFHSK